MNQNFETIQKDLNKQDENLNARLSMNLSFFITIGKFPFPEPEFMKKMMVPYQIEARQKKYFSLNNHS